MHRMRTTALLTFTGAGTVINDWLNGLAIGSAGAPGCLLMALAVTGLGILTLHSERIRTDRPAEVTASSPAAPVLQPEA